MYRIRLIYPGKTKSAFVKEGILEYVKYIRPYARLDFIEVKTTKGSPEKVISEESGAILKAIKGDFILLDRLGVQVDSIGFSNIIRDNRELQFVIGGAYGVSEELKDRACMKISLSSLTFTHEISRLILIEQIYRAMTIIHKKPYHH